MTAGEVYRLNREIVAAWADQLDADHAVAVLLIGLGRDHRDRELTIARKADLPPAVAREILRVALATVDREIAEGGTPT